MLSGQVATPRSVSGVTTAPSRMPISTKQTRASHSGTFIGRPQQRRDGDRQHRARHQPRRKADHREGDAAGERDHQRLGDRKMS